MLRIRRLSRNLKAMMLLYFVAAPLYFTRPGWHWELVSMSDKLMAIISAVIFLAMAVTFYRLLNLFEKGVFFSTKSVRCLMLLGYLAFSEGLLGVIAPVIASGVVTLGLLLAAIGSPWVVGGLFVIMLSHIMDEGCKMQEEQDLTV